MTNPKSNHQETKVWGYIDKRDRACEAGIWVGVEPCYSEEQGKARAWELEQGKRPAAPPLLSLRG